MEESIEPAWNYVNGGYADEDELFPSIAGLAVYLKKSRETIHKWAREYPQFSDIVCTLLAIQEKKLTKGGIVGDYNASITKLLLTKHGYSDKVDTALTGAEGGPIQVEEVKRVVIDPKH